MRLHMRRWRAVASLTCVLALALGDCCRAADPKDILWYGNSFTNATCCGSSVSVPVTLGALAVAAGHPAPRNRNAAVNGQSLQFHLTSNTGVITTGIVAGEQWEHVVLQDFSTIPTHIGNMAQHLSSSLGLYQAVAAHSPGVQAIMYETWSRGYGNGFYTGGSPAFPGGPAQMQQELRDGYQASTANIQSVGGPQAVRLAAAGDAWELANWPANFYGDGDYHASNRGTLLNALVLYTAIYDDPTTSDINLSTILTPLGLTAADGVFLTGLADTIAARQIPEPTTLALAVLGALGAALRARRRA